ncbi:ABC-type antimicrobial peptide transport system, ATPase component [hydrothermal vent metagenome]|uniref:ABC-type antimicrobial peptide transport system, ATPase component n=1 Tax=hydrothermal vent metagenome TaxID=652676 RepID=A0A3B1E1C8_9ZZZZ
MSLTLHHIKKSYREPGGGTVPILDIELFEIQPAEQVVLVGESGGGKTTLLNIVSGISLPDAGDVIVDRVNISKLPEAARDRFRAERLGFVFQTFNLLAAFSALENVQLGMSFGSGKSDRGRAVQLLERVGLGHRLHHRPGQLSVGEQQRVSVARSLANSPKLLLADEPTASVDSTNQEMILQLIRETCEENQIALLLVTHSSAVAEQFSRVEKLSQFNKSKVTA